MFSKTIKQHAEKHVVLSSYSHGEILSGEIQSGISDEIYTPLICGNKMSCGCKHMFYHVEPCSHLYALINSKPEYINKVIIGESMRPRFVKTKLKAIQRLVKGIPVGSPIGVYGSPEAGKSTLTIQLMFELLAKRKTHKNGLIIDTEGSSFTISEWLDTFNDRYDLGAEIVFVRFEVNEKAVGRGYSKKIKMIYDPPKFESPTIFVFDVRNVEDLLTLIGKSSTLTISPKGKIDLLPDSKLFKTDFKDSLLYEIIEKYKIKALCLDSISYPLQTFGMSRSNFPVRAQAANWIMSAVHNISERLELCSFVVAHQTLDPADTYSKPEFTGGKAVLHALKFILYIAAKASSHTPKTDVPNRGKNDRELWNKRHPSKEPFGMYQMMTLTNEGFVDKEL